MIHVAASPELPMRGGGVGGRGGPGLVPGRAGAQQMFLERTGIRKSLVEEMSSRLRP